MSLPEHVKVAIVGSGPAGFTAAIYTARANLEPLLFEGGGLALEPVTLPGGQLTITTEVDNYPGFPKGVQGPEMMEIFRAQAERFGTEVVYESAEHVDFQNRPFTVISDSGTRYSTRTVIVATGATAKLLGLESEHKLMGF